MSDVEELEIENIGSAGLLSATYHFMMSRVMEALSCDGYGDLSKTQLHVLARFGYREITLDELSQRVKIPVQILANVAHTLSTNEYILEVSESTILRTVGYRLTPRGHEALEIVDKSQRSVEREWIDQLGEEKVQTVIESLKALFDATMGVAR